MSDHYFSKNPDSEHRPQQFTFTLRGKEYRFNTDAGVFSKSEVDFGSRLLIDTFEWPDIEGPILDAGCGYGPIGISLAAEQPERTVHMIDVNDRALRLARENARLNKIENLLIYESDRLQNVSEEGFAAVLTNPPIRAGKQTVFDILQNGFAKLADGGEIWVVIQKKQGAPSAIKELERLAGSCDTAAKSKGYFILHAKK
ncbi:class I SAM-dependent methyltransferase [Domibacillus epiphyticus]|uniref:16S rRNA methyltransferase n=1 Tax=Domibacillus epiphyticus TaxID=1714355 RepID=A0A1V2AAF1_9BACI|nr:class I SAM-dependent methyltransferase [Domibacillus epiphyticus]OMP67979.1 16S rRNA methyltransferase [Domibacillus epiphyticus]